MDLTNITNPAILPGQRLLQTNNGWQGAEKYPTPRDTVVPIFDSDESYLYIKTTDANGGSSLRRFKLEEDPIPVFDPDKYVTKEDFNALKEEITNGFNSIQQSLAGANTKQNSYKPANKPNNEQRQS